MQQGAKPRSIKTGLPPGSLVYIGAKKRDDSDITVISYDQMNCMDKKLQTMDEYLQYKKQNAIKWLDIDGIDQIHILERLEEYFGIHPLVLEDVLNTNQRPKIEDYGNYIYIVAKMLCYDHSRKRIVSDQLSLIFGKDYVITLQEREGDVFNPIRDRIRNNVGHIRKMGPDYLAYTLLDTIVDNYFIILEEVGNQIEYIEEELLQKPSSAALHSMHQLKKEMLRLHKSIWPLREVLGAMERRESELINESTILYIRDAYDHAIQLIDTVETYRDMLSGMLDIYLSSTSNRMNEVMKVLTVFSSIFMPLTFIAGVYGMNFRYMPELDSPWGYPLIMLVMAVIGGSMTFYFRRRKWW
ncbi:MAG: magnesium/cobalt transporter CorA [Clostridia bacterium]|nr:magnesium/cobalt transporter CorA [Clostridia bacterium]